MTFVPSTLMNVFGPVHASAASKGRAGGPPLSPAAEVLAEMRAGTDTRMRQYLDAQRAEYLRQPVFASLYEDLAEFVCRPGKRLRPLLFLLANRVFGAGKSPVPAGDLFSIATSLELLHAFILVHDDIIDRAEARRGLPSLHRLIEGRLSSFADRGRTGRNLALVMGDILFALAQRCLLEIPLTGNLSARLGSLLLGCMVETGFGEVADIVHGTRDVAKVDSDEIEQMYCLKTTCYTIECPLTMAATLNGVSKEGLEAIGRLARPAGLAFQIQNDLQEFARFEISDSEVPADILEGKKTLLIRTAYDLLSETDRGFLQLCFSSGTPTEGTVSKARELICKSGAVTRLTHRMEQLFAEADAETRNSGFGSEVQTGLRELIQLVRGSARS